ncbi:MAG: hypothetical protein U1E61_23165 [Bradyrhizobium sp.]
MTEKVEYLDIAQRIRALMSYRWTYWDGRRVLIYQDGFEGTGSAERGPTYEALRKYSLGETKPNEDSLLRMLRVLMTQMKNPPKLSIELLRSTTPIRNLYEALGNSPEQIEAILFTYWAQYTANLCNSFTFENVEKAEAFSQSHSPGLYIGERTPQERPSAKPHKFALAVLGKTPASTQDRGKKRFFIPVMLTIRSCAGTSLFSYRGAISPMSRGLEWAFFQEGKGMLDRIRIMTSDGDSRYENPYLGSMLTMTEGPTYRDITYKVSIRRYSQLTSWAATSQFLIKTPTPTSSSVNSEHKIARRYHLSGERKS